LYKVLVITIESCLFSGIAVLRTPVIVLEKLEAVTINNSSFESCMLASTSYFNKKTDSLTLSLFDLSANVLSIKEHSTFTSNICVSCEKGTLKLYSNFLEIVGSYFRSNSAANGGVLYIL